MIRIQRVAVLVLLVACTSATRAGTTRPVEVGNVMVTRVADGVYAAIRTEPLALAVNANSMFVVGDDGVAVVDAQFTRQATLENIAALRAITSKPVRFVINTHWHDDHVAGNQVYRDSFPNVRFLAHAATRDDLVTKGRENRTGQVRFAPQAAERFERLLKMGLGPDSTATTSAERDATASAVRIIRQYVAENVGYQEVLPDSLTERRTVLPLKGRTVELRWFGRGNTRGDLVAWLPRERVIATGDLVVAPMPFAFNSYPTEWIATLDSIQSIAPAIIVPGHGPIMRDFSYVSRVRGMLVTARDEVRAAIAKGHPADSVRLQALREEVAGSEKWPRAMFAMFFRSPVVTRLFEETRSGPLK